MRISTLSLKGESFLLLLVSSVGRFFNNCISIKVAKLVLFSCSLAWRFSSLSEFAEHLAESVDIVFPVIHGKFGEDGGIQELLEKHSIPFVGTGSSECRRAFDKGTEGDESALYNWFSSNQLDTNSGKVVALAEEPPMYPHVFFRRLLDLASENHLEVTLLLLMVFKVFSNYMGTKSEPEISNCKALQNWTKVSFKPDLERFTMTHLEDDVVAMKKTSEGRVERLAWRFSSLSEFAEHLAESVDIVFPELLEKHSIPFVGTGSSECRRAFDKYEASLELSKQGFITVPSILAQGTEGDESALYNWFTSNQLDTNSGKVVVKPVRAGSSIGVSVAYGVANALKNAKDVILEGIDDKVIVEIFLEGGSEFTAIILDLGSGSDCQPVVLIPSEVELHFSEKDAIFNYRRKYLPTRQVSYHTPPRFPLEVITSIREGASQLFRQLGLRDFARIDGWFLPSSTNSFSDADGKFGKSDLGTLLFTDINLISGMEQTSFLFQQASKVGFSHSNILRSIIYHASSRFPNLEPFVNTSGDLPRRSKPLHSTEALNGKDVRKVFVIFGGDSSERQVSVMSATNVWLNLQAFADVEVIPCLLAPSDDQSADARSRTVWKLP
ncbi:D-alanine--D-alanine ligase [Linum grandiflorum]